MMKPTRLSVFVVAGCVVGAAPVVGQTAPQGKTLSFGYPTVAEAYAELSARPDMNFVDAAGWLQAQDPTAPILWSFSKPGAPTHPTGVRREFVGRGANIKIFTNMRCGAEKARCDEVAAEFQCLSAELRLSYRQSYAASVVQRGYQPTPAQDDAARQVMTAFFAALDDARYDVAYAMLDDGLKASASREQFTALQQRMREQAAPAENRAEPVVTWYHNPPNGPAGTFAAFDVDARSAQGRSWSETVIVRQLPNGSFAVMRHVRDIVDLPGLISVIGTR